MIGIKPEIVQCPKPDCIRVLVLRKGFAVPGDRIAGLSDTPRCAAVTLTVKRAVVWPAGFLRWRMESDVTDVGAGAQRHAKGLNRAIQVLIIQSVLVVPDSRTGVSYLITHKPDPIVSRVGLVLI